MLKRFALVCCAFISISGWANNATILLYHHVSSDTPPSTSISVQRFREHMQLLRDDYHVISISKLVNHLKSKTPLPENSVVITFDDGFRNILQNADPILQEFEFPYAIFINTVDVGMGDKMDWQELRSLQGRNVTIANHFYDHRHMLDRRAYPLESEWLEETRALLNKTEAELEANLGTSHKLFAYPYGEFDKSLQQMLEEEGYIAFAQHSGAVGNYTDFTAIPRFPAAGIYAGLNSLKVKLSSLNMPVLETSQQAYKYLGKHKPEYRLKIASLDLRPTQLQCFYEGNPIDVEWHNDWAHINVDKTLSPGRHRVNCTAPSISQPGRYYWHSQPWFIANEDGSWLE